MSRKGMVVLVPRLDITINVFAGYVGEVVV
jgi:hypothetical protein